MKHDEIKYKHAAACAKVMSNAMGFCHSLLDNHVILNGVYSTSFDAAAILKLHNICSFATLLFLHHGKTNWHLWDIASVFFPS